MKLVSARPFYRKASANSPAEDSSIINSNAGIFAVCDGVSGPYSPSNPGLVYPGEMTGGQMVSQKVCDYISLAKPTDDVESILLNTNREVSLCHLVMEKDPLVEAVAGACFAACQLFAEEVKLVLAGDCFACWKDNQGYHFLTNFNQAAFDFEQKGNRAFDECKEKTKSKEKPNGDIRDAWDLYFPYFSKKQRFRANRNLGKGGHAILNGDPALRSCWTVQRFNIASCPQFILLGTDGLLPSVKTDPRNEKSLADKLGSIYLEGGLATILKWRDENEKSLSHITGWPEASAIELKFN